MPRLEFTIAVKPFGAQAQKDAAKLTGELRTQDKEVSKLTKSTQSFSKEFAKHTDVVKRSTHDVTSLIEGMASKINRVNEKIGESFKHTFEKVKDHVKEALSVSTGMFLHDAIEKVIDLPKRLLEAGKGNIEARERLGREFGRGDASFIERISKRVGKRAGFDDSAAITALFPVAEAVDSVQAGTMYRGRKLNEGQAAQLREQLFGKGASLFERITTTLRTSPEEANQIGYLLANAGTGPEGMRGLVSALHLNRAYSSRLLQANAKGRGVELVDPRVAQELGLKRGQQIGQGDILDILLRKSGITEKAAEDERKKFGFQVKSIGATFESALGDVGERVLTKVTEGFAKGKTLAEKFQEALESPKGKQMIDKIADGLIHAAEAAIKLGSEIPKVINFLEAHKTALAILGGGYAGLSVLGKFGIAEKIPGVGKIADALTAVPVRVTNWPGGGLSLGGEGGGSVPGVVTKYGLKAGAVGIAGLVGLAIGGAAGYGLDKGSSYLEDKYGINLNPFTKNSGKTLKAADAEIARLKAIRDQRRFARANDVGSRAFGPGDQPTIDEFRRRVTEQESTVFGPGDSAGLAAFLKGSGQQQIVIHNTLTLDGKIVAQNVERRQLRDARNETANGVSR